MNIDLYDFATCDLTGILHGCMNLDRIPIDCRIHQLAVKCCIRHAIAKWIPWTELLLIIIPVTDVDTFAIRYMIPISWEIHVCWHILDPLRECNRQFTRWIYLTCDHIGKCLCTCHTRKERCKDCLYIVCINLTHIDWSTCVQN